MCKFARDARKLSIIVINNFTAALPMSPAPASLYQTASGAVGTCPAVLAALTAMVCELNWGWFFGIGRDRRSRVASRAFASSGWVPARDLLEGLAVVHQEYRGDTSIPERHDLVG